MMQCVPTLADIGLNVGEVIPRSWQRCRALGLESGTSVRLGPITANALREVQERSATLRHWAKPDLELLDATMRELKGVALLTDAQGCILDAMGDPSFSDRAHRVALLPGVEWSEARAGTNAIGTALVECGLVEVVGSEHFFAANHILRCTALPIVDPQGKVAGALDVSGDAGAPEGGAAALVRLAVASIEHRWALRSAAPGDLVVRLHRHPAWLGTPHEGVLVLRGGTVVAANSLAHHHLGDHLLKDQANIALLEEMLYSENRTLGLGESLVHLRVERKPSAASRARVTTEKSPAVFSEDGVIWDTTTLPLRRTAERAFRAGIPLLLQGPTGSGKELFVRALHQRSDRAQRPLVAVNCAAIPESLFEAELFGYVGGAFTGARKTGSPGRLLEADGGVLFLDEIGDMPLLLQGRLLRVLQDRMVQPLGGGRERRVDFLVIAATHRPLEAEVAAGRFRQDLYYRLRHLRLSLPGLRERPELPDILRALMVELGAQRRRITLSPTARERLLRYTWPGNFRELVNVLRTMVALAEDGVTLDIGDLPSELQQQDTQEISIAAPASLQRTEADMIQQALSSCGGNVSAAARQLGIHRTTLHRKLKRSSVNGQES